MSIKACGIIIYRISNEIPEILLLECSYNGEWGPPKGHVDPGEDDLQTAFRETEEEAGIKKSEITLHENFHEEIRYKVKKSTHSGDIMKDKVSVYFLGKVSSEQRVTISHEHTGYKWLTFDEAIKSVIFDNYAKIYSSAQKFVASL